MTATTHGPALAGGLPALSLDRRVSLRPAFVLLALQLLVCVGTVTRVTGFRWS